MAVLARAYATGIVSQGHVGESGKKSPPCLPFRHEESSQLRGAPAGFQLHDMKRMKVTVEAIFEFPDDYGIAPDHDDVPSLKIGRKIFVPTVHWMEQAIVLESVIPRESETEPSRGFQPADKDTHGTIMCYQTIEDSFVEMAEDESDANLVKLEPGQQEFFLAGRVKRRASAWRVAGKPVSPERNPDGQRSD